MFEISNLHLRKGGGVTDGGDDPRFKNGKRRIRDIAFLSSNFGDDVNVHSKLRCDEGLCFLEFFIFRNYGFKILDMTLMDHIRLLFALMLKRVFGF